MGTVTPNQTLRSDSLWSDTSGTALVRPDGSLRSVGNSMLRPPLPGRSLVGGITSVRGLTRCTASYIERVAPSGVKMRGVRVQANGGADTSCEVEFDFNNASTISSGQVAFAIYTEQPSSFSKLAGFVLYISDATFANYFSASESFYRDGWYLRSPNLPSGTASEKWYAAAGSPTFGTTSFTRAKVRTSFTAGEAPWFEVFAIYEKPVFALPPPIVITFDDGYDTQITNASPIIESYGLTMSLSLIPSLLGAAGMMTLAQAQAAVARGHEVVCHGPINGTGSLANYSASPTRAADIYADVAGTRDYLVSNGLAVNGSERVYVWPQGVDYDGFGDTVIQEQVAAAGFRMARGVSTNFEVSPSPFISEADSMYLPIIGHGWVSEATEAANIAAIQARLTENAAAGKASILMFHQCITGTPTTSLHITTTRLASICKTIADLQAAGSARCTSMTGLYEALTGRSIAEEP